MQGKIIKGIAGFYYVDVAESGVYECKAKGIFRKEKKKPLVGDNVEIEVLDEKEKTGNLIQILPRKNELIRPAAANVDQALVIFAVRQPDPNYQLLDRFLITMEQQEIPSIICFNKKDLAEQEELDLILYMEFPTSTYSWYMNKQSPDTLRKERNDMLNAILIEAEVIYDDGTEETCYYKIQTGTADNYVLFERNL